MFLFFILIYFGNRPKITQSTILKWENTPVYTISIILNLNTRTFDCFPILSVFIALIEKTTRLGEYRPTMMTSI